MGAAYLMARFFIEVPIMFLTACVALMIPAYGISGFNPAYMGVHLVLWALTNLVFDCWGQVLALSFDNFLLGMATYITNVWFNSFLFGGFLVPETDIIWPLRLCVYMFPFKWCIRSFTYIEFFDRNWEECEGNVPDCYGTQGKEILNSVGSIIKIYSGKDKVALDFVILCAMVVVLKSTYAFLLFFKARKVSKVLPVKGATVATTKVTTTAEASQL